MPVLAQITTVDEAKTFYPLFGLGANVALIFSGRAVKYFSNVRGCTASRLLILCGLSTRGLGGGSAKCNNLSSADHIRNWICLVATVWLRHVSKPAQ